MSVHLTRSDEVFSIICEMISAQLGISTPLEPETSLHDTLGMDSLEVVELGVDLEKKLALTLPDERLRACATLGDLVTVVLDAEQESE
jgi:acyl carrier protein